MSPDHEPDIPSSDTGPGSPALSERIGAVVAGRYVIERELGRGGMATVYLADDRKHGRLVALKFLDAVPADPLAVERFMREIETIAKLTHPHILALYDSGEADGSLYFVMPYVQGESVRTRLEREHQLPVEDVIRLGLEVCDALRFAHGQGVIHRDIKPENLLLSDGHTLVADFGIAQASLMGSFPRITMVGMVVGTPAYMSPEQACGDAVDGRSDIYSLACVLYEALAGDPPFGGRLRGQPILTQRLVTPPASLREQRREIPVALERAINRGLQPLPSDRFATAADFASAIATATPSGASRARTMGLRRRWAMVATAAVVIAVVATAAWNVFRHPRAASALDTSRYAVFPFQHPGGVGPALLAGDNCERLFGDALARWQGVTPVSDLVLHEGMIGREATLRSARSLAAAHRAGRLIWGTVISSGPSGALVQAVVYDVTTGEAHARATVRVAVDLHDAPEMFNALADSLMMRVAGATLTPGGAVGTRSVPALEAYVAAHRTLAVWHLAEAREGFRAATHADSDFALAQLWLAQTGAWTSTGAWASAAPSPEWPAAARRANSLRDRLGWQDRERAGALSALADRNYPAACARYSGLVRADSLDFIAWYGLGQCLSANRLVVRDPASASGWRFQTSEHAAIHAYVRALDLIPSFQQAFVELGSAQLGQLLYTEPGIYRSGYALTGTGDTLSFGAFPALVRDTLAFVPVPLADIWNGGPWPPTYPAAIASNRRLLGRVTTRWVQAVPSSAVAHLQLARVLESVGQLDSRAGNDTSAMSEVRRAREMARTTADSLSALVAAVRVHLKLSQFAAARALADSALAHAVSPTASQAALLAPLAALTGRVERTANTLRLTAAVDTVVTPQGAVVPPALPAAEALAFLAYASLGAPVDSMRATEERAVRLIREWVDARSRPALSDALLSWPATLAFPEIGLQTVHSPRTDNVELLGQWHLAHRDTAALRRLLMDPRRAPEARYGPAGPDELRAVSLLWLAIGDTVAATRELDDLLNSLPRYGTRLLDDVPQPASLVRDMALRAELAIRAGDGATGRRWARGVEELWAGADDELQPVVRRARAISATPDR